MSREIGRRRDYTQPSSGGVPVVTDAALTGAWVQSPAGILTPSAFAAPPSVGGLAAELKDNASNGIHEITLAFNVQVANQYLFTGVFNVARAVQGGTGNKQRGLLYMVTGAPFPPDAGAIEGPGILMTTNFGPGPDGGNFNPAWGSTGNSLLPEFVYYDALWSSAQWSAVARATGVATLHLRTNGQNSGNYVPAYDSAPDPLTVGFGIAAVRVLNVTGLGFGT
jgi:hypothetical protein